ncbi:hypothetical protein JCM10908_004324 [Rhodotorula pacifica]|uniref:uncharacterized protein n=1 Tax=Rhodotorula pacifica TaxID=1495444 RepID=UPI003173AE20
MATSSSTRPGTPSNLVQVHTYRHLSPAYAAIPSQGGTMPPPPSTSTSTLTFNNHAAVKPFTSQEVRQLVLEYLTHEGYVDSAIAFAREVVLDEAESAASGEADGGQPPIRLGDPHRGASATETDAMQEDLEAAAGTDTAAMMTDGGMPTILNGSDPRGLNGAGAGGGGGKNVAFLDGAEAGASANPEGAGLNGDETAAPSALSKEQIQDLRLRKAIRDAIVTGRIGQAVDLLNEHYPAVLAPTSTSTFPTIPSVSSKSAFARPLAAAAQSRSATCTPQTFFVAPNPATRSSPAPNQHPSSSSHLPITGAQFGSWALSLSPEIVGLNLQTQTFIELMRTAHATSAISTPSTPTSSVHGSLAGNGASGDAHSDAEMSASTSSLGGSASILNIAIAQSQALREKVLQLLPGGKDREGWERECIDVCGLLAYKDIATCPVRGYLAQSRRDILAEMVNSAILQHTGRTPLSLLSLATRQATAMWDTLREMNHPFPPPEAITTGRDRDSNNGKNKPPRTYPVFDLHTFLHDREAASVPPSDQMET